MENNFWLATDKEGNCYAFKSKPFRTTINTWETEFMLPMVKVSSEACLFFIGSILTWKDEPIKAFIAIL